jgi:hypothetical protein
VLGLIDGEVVEIGESSVEVALAVVTRLLGVGGELLTAIVRADALADLEAPIRARLAQLTPFVEAAIYPDPLLDCVVLVGLE